MQHIYTETNRLEDENLQLLKHCNRRGARVLKTVIRTNVDFFLLSRTGDTPSKLHLTNHEWPNNAYSVFSIEPLQLFHLDVSKTLNSCTAAYLLSCKRLMCILRSARDERGRVLNRAQLSHGCTNLLASYERDFPVSRLYIDFMRSQKTDYLNKLFTASGSDGMLDGKHYCAFDAVFPFLAAFLNRSIECSTNPVSLSIKTFYSDIVNLVVYEPCVFTANDGVVSFLLLKIEN